MNELEPATIVTRLPGISRKNPSPGLWSVTKTSKLRGNGAGIPVIEPITPDPEQLALMFSDAGVCVAVAVAVRVFVAVRVAVAQLLGVVMAGMVSSEYEGSSWSYAGSELGLLDDEPSYTLMLPLLTTGNVEPESESRTNELLTGWSITVKPAAGAGCVFSVSK